MASVRGALGVLGAAGGRALAALIDLVLPGECAGCGAAGGFGDLRRLRAGTGGAAGSDQAHAGTRRAAAMLRRRWLRGSAARVDSRVQGARPPGSGRAGGRRARRRGRRRRDGVCSLAPSGARAGPGDRGGHAGPAGRPHASPRRSCLSPIATGRVANGRGGPAVRAAEGGLRSYEPAGPGARGSGGVCGAPGSAAKVLAAAEVGATFVICWMTW